MLGSTSVLYMPRAAKASAHEGPPPKASGRGFAIGQHVSCGDFARFNTRSGSGYVKADWPGCLSPRKGPITSLPG